MSARFPTPDTRLPITLPDGTPFPGVVFLSAVLTHPRIEVGAYSYASAHTPPEDWAAHLAPYLYDFSPERLVIGKFCQIADGVQFITSSANHRHDGVTTFPFAIFGGDPVSMPGPGPDTVIGNDVWIGQGARILPGARIGDGVIVGTGAVVGGTVPPYSVVAGNPARILRPRFPPEIVARLLELRWWDWPIDRILAAQGPLCTGDLAALDVL
jgi:virginiamycin A acetyltransferase